MMSEAIATIEPHENAPTSNVTVFDPMQMIQIALERGQSAEMIDKLISLGERMATINARKAFDAAMSAAKAEIPVIKKSREVDFVNKLGQRTHYFHEDMAGIAETVDPILARHGLSYRFQPFYHEGRAYLRCIIAHRDGYREESESPAPVDSSGNKNVHQQQSSGYTYTQRMMLKMALGLAAGRDDDGRAAGEDDPPPLSISNEQARRLRDALTFKGRSEAEFCAVLKVQTIEDIPAARFDACMKAIQNAKEKSNA